MGDSPRSEVSQHNLSTDTPKTQATKDRLCQYCQQPFTSSSLGRHLDQFVFKKKPDGIHNVDEIRMQRGGITRRSAKRSAHAKHGDPDESRSTPNTTSPANYGSPGGDAFITVDATPESGIRYQPKPPNWQATGVINGLSASTTGSPALGANASRHGKRKYSSLETSAAKDILSLRGDIEPEKDTVRALELALREVLDTVQAARIRASPPPTPFHIDIHSHSFPSLVLKLLPAPPTLLTPSTPVATTTSFPISCPPQQAHMFLLQATVMSLVSTWTSNLLHQPRSQLSADIDIATLAEKHQKQAIEHVKAAYEEFASRPTQQQMDIWTTELARAFASEKQKREDTEARLEAVLAEARQLSDQVDRLSRCQWPREMALWPPKRKPIGRHVLQQMDKVDGSGRPQPTSEGNNATEIERIHNGMDDHEDDEESKRWDYDTLVDKWQRIVREDTGRRYGLPHLASTAASGNSGSRNTSTPNAPHSKNSINTPGRQAASSTTTKNSNATTTTATKHQPERWTKRPGLITGDDYMMAIPPSASEQQQQQQHQHRHRLSNLRQLVPQDADVDTDADADADEDMMDPPPPPHNHGLDDADYSSPIINTNANVKGNGHGHGQNGNAGTGGVMQLGHGGGHQDDGDGDGDGDGGGGGGDEDGEYEDRDRDVDVDVDADSSGD